MNKQVCLGQSILDIKTLTFEFYYDYITLKYQDNAKYAIWIEIVLWSKWKQNIKY